MFQPTIPMPPYFIIKIGKEAQRERKEKIGSLYFPSEYAYLKRGMQFGEIVAIGSAAANYMPCASIGDYLLHHHFIEGKVSNKGHNFYIVDSDEEFNYYAVNAFEIPGERAMAYAVAIGEEIIPTPDYIFLELPKEDDAESVEGADMMKVSESGLYVPKEKTKTRDQWTQIMKKNMARIKELSYNLPTSAIDQIMIMENPQRRERYEYAMSEIKHLESINLKISKDINKKKYEPFVVAALNEEWNDGIERSFGERIRVGDTAYFLNQACHCEIEFSGITFLVVETKYFACSEKYIKDAIECYRATKAAPTSRSRNKSVRH